MFQFREFQSRGINQVAALAGNGVRKIVFQAATGAGKTVLFAGLVQRFLTKYPNARVVIAVHRVELLKQTVAALHRVTGIDAAMLIAGHTTPVREVNNYMVPFSTARVIICMVETLHRRFTKYSKYMGDIQMLIVDEAHRGEFNKIYDHFPESLIIGFTATPLSADKRKPMKLYFEEIVSPVTINELITQGHLAKNITIAIKGAVNRKKLAVRGGEFDEQAMATVYSSAKHVENCVKAYEKYCMGEKTLVFNCNIEHSLKVNAAFIEAGFNSRHMDGTATKEQRTEILDWFANTHDAVLQNVGLYTTGLDEPTILNTIVNRATMSLPLWIQMAGRAARAIPGVKDHFKIIDLGENEASLLDWNYPHDWVQYFKHPERARPKKGTAPTKLCPKCDEMIHISCQTCPHCGEDLSGPPEEYDTTKIDLEVLTKGIDIEALIRKNAQYKPYRALHIAKGQLVNNFRLQYHHQRCEQHIREELNNRYQQVVKDWCREHGKDYNHWHKVTTRQWLMTELDIKFGKVADYPQKKVTA